MKKIALLVSVVPALAFAQVGASASFRVDLPVVLPQLVVVQPGIQVVPDVETEVFFTNGYYWVREDGGWYRARDHRGGWVLVEPRRVPPGLVRIPPGQYKKYHREGPAAYRGAPAPAYRGAPAPAYRGGPAPAYRGELREGRYEDRDDDRHEGKHEGRGKGHGGKHGRD